MSRNIISGSLRMYCGVVYLLFIGFGLAIGAEAVSHDANGPWWPRTKSLYWAFLTVPIYSLFLSMRNQVPGWNKEMILKKVTAEFCVGSTLKHPNIIATVDIVSDPRRASASPSTSPSAARPCPPARALSADHLLMTCTRLSFQHESVDGNMLVVRDKGSWSMSGVKFNPIGLNET
ncbi:hypothetical protein B0H14DRAFT_3885040 [Mycena olivaceomarginata]|nr:hypothetical protein B0H14DRAFT_3885040 [Mycena olivaceomarginata]